VKATPGHSFRYTPAVRKLAIFGAFAALAPACVGTDTSSRSEALRPSPAGVRVVLLSLDGLAAGRHRENLRESVYTDKEGLAAFEVRGFVVESAIRVDPPLTAWSLAQVWGAAAILAGIALTRTAAAGGAQKDLRDPAVPPEPS
jgi:hypothetical protein